MTATLKNNEKGSIQEYFIDDQSSLITINNKNQKSIVYSKEIESTFIQIHFCLQGNAQFIFNQNTYKIEVKEKKSIILYNPQKKLPIQLKIHPNTSLISILISIKEFHKIFSTEANYIPFLSKENKNNKYYDEMVITPSVFIVLQQIFTNNIQNSIKEIYLKGKVLELLSLYFHYGEASDIEHCPFLVDSQNVLKIKKAKDIIVSKMANPPSLSQLSEEVGLSLKNLKEGFKQVYGDSVYSFLLDYKMEFARRLLEDKKNNVNEVGLQIGYSTSSHFIAAFKKKYGITPKKYAMSLKNLSIETINT